MEIKNKSNKKMINNFYLGLRDWPNPQSPINKSYFFFLRNFFLNEIYIFFINFFFGYFIFYEL